MAIHISLESTEIPVQIGDFSYTVSMDDDSLQEMNDAIHKVHDEMKGIDESDIEIIRDSVSKAFDVILGDGAFGDLYEKTPSTMILSSILLELGEGLREEFINKTKKDVQPDRQPRKRNRYKR